MKIDGVGRGALGSSSDTFSRELCRVKLATAVCFLMFSDIAIAEAEVIQQAECQLHSMAAYPQPDGGWQIDSQPYGSVYVRKRASAPWQVVTQQEIIDTEPSVHFEQAEQLLRAMGLNDRTPPAWRGILIKASEDVNALDAVSYEEGDVRIEMVLVGIASAAPLADLPGGAVLGAARIADRQADGNWLYAQMWGTSCFDPEQ